MSWYSAITTGLRLHTGSAAYRRCSTQPVTQDFLQENSLKFLRAFASPHEYWLASEASDESVSRLTEALEEFMSPERVAKIHDIARRRIASLTVIADNPRQLGNIHAMARGMECFGFHSLNIVGELKTPPRYNQERCKDYNRAIGVGSSSWMSVREWENVEDVIGKCKSLGFQTIALSISENSVSVDDVDMTIPTAVILGSECSGVSSRALELVDKEVTIPMRGWTESLNMSNAIAVLMYHIFHQRQAKFGSNYCDMSPAAENWMRLFFLSQKLGSALVRSRLQRFSRSEVLTDTFSYETMELRHGQSTTMQKAK